MQFTFPATLHTVHGSFKLKRGAIRFDPATGKIGGELVVDASSGASGDEGRDRRMHKDILESGRYPEIVFTPDRVDGAIAPQGVSQIQVHGVFRIHGAEHEITYRSRCGWPTARHPSSALHHPLCEMGNEESQHASSCA